jgi:hypothetical protein
VAVPGRFRPYLRPPEINIYSKTQEQADIAALLLYAAHALIESSIPTTFTGWDPYGAKPVLRRREDVDGEVDSNQPPLRSQFGSAVDVAGLTVRIARRRALTDAAFYFLASVYSVSSHPMNLHPSYGSEPVERIDNPMHRVWEAQSIFAAFQSIEALNLTVKGAGPDRPSITNGTWNAEIRSDLEARLGKIGVVATDTVLWLRRGSPTAVQRQLANRTSASTSVSWQGGRIRDERIPYIDAINRAQWLRSNVSAHKAGKRLRGLHTVDALNVQHVARMLVMHAAGFPWWRDRRPG